ncbi:4Fe-4S ferredoxin [candidate division KSB1 bacterium]|nr:4Fe-4S ferredoxin [candidate division KSB1 bacterium]
MSLADWNIRAATRFFSQRFSLARLSRLPLLGRVIDYLFFRGDRIYYLPRVQTISIGEKLEKPENIVLPGRIIEQFIRQTPYRFIMNFCICRKASQCTDYPIEFGCLFLGEAVLRIDASLGRLVSQEEALEYVQTCQQAGLVHLIGKNRLDTVWLDIGPGDKLLTICNCCPCCCLWKMIPDLAPHIQSKITKAPGVHVEVLATCNGCGRCLQQICFVNAIRMVNGKAVISDRCRGCGRCVEVCPQKAIILRMDNVSGFGQVEAEIKRVIKL